MFKAEENPAGESLQLEGQSETKAVLRLCERAEKRFRLTGDGSTILVQDFYVDYLKLFISKFRPLKAIAMTR